MSHTQPNRSGTGKGSRRRPPEPSIMTRDGSRDAAIPKAGAPPCGESHFTANLSCTSRPRGGASPTRRSCPRSPEAGGRPPTHRSADPTSWSCRPIASAEKQKERGTDVPTNAPPERRYGTPAPLSASRSSRRSRPGQSDRSGADNRRGPKKRNQGRPPDIPDQSPRVRRLGPTAHGRCAGDIVPAPRAHHR